MPVVKHFLTHRAIVEEYNKYDLTQDDFNEFVNLPEDEREEYLYNKYDSDDSTTTITDILETTDSSIEW